MVAHLKPKSTQPNCKTTRITLYNEVSSLTILTRVDLNLPGLRRQDRDGRDGRADVAQLPALVGGGRRVRLGHRRRQTM